MAREFRRKTLLLTSADVRSVLDMSRVIEATEEAFRQKATRHTQMPAKTYLFYRKHNGDLRCMPSYIEGKEVSAVKIVNVHPDNPEKKGLPSVMGLVVLVDPSTGFPLAIMDGTRITEMRTGAASAVASKYLARRDSRVLAMIGAGKQARTQVLGQATTFGHLREVRVFDISKPHLQSFAKELREQYAGRIDKVVSCDSVQKVLEGSDIVITATPSREPFVKEEWIRPGVHFNCIGADAPGKQEIEPDVFKKVKLVIDDWEQTSHSGEINVAFSKGIITKADVHAEIGEIVAGTKPGRTSDNEITLFSSTGLGVQDAMTAKLVFDEATRRGLGQEVNLVLS